MKGSTRRKTQTLTQNEINDHHKQQQQPTNDNEEYQEQQEQLPKLPDGFYVIESLKKRRIRKGKTQYLVKWRDWPESANSWEPVENLTSCADFIVAFEESLKSGENRPSRKRKGKRAVGPTPESKKKQEQQLPQHSPDATYPMPSAKLKIIEVPLPIRSVNQSNFSNVTENNDETFDQSNGSGSLTGSPQTDEKKEKNELDVTGGEVKATFSTNQENKNEFAIHIQKELEAEGVSPVEVGPTNVVSNVVDETEVLRVCPQIGAKRRKSCAVKRYKQLPNSAPKKDATEKTVDADDVPVQDDDDVKIGGDMGDGFDSENVVDTPVNVIVITKIMKPVNYSTSVVNDTEEVCVSFLVQRSDGAEVIVDNKYLKENNPLLLINFYEKHLRYNSCPSD